jgi:hypothetical protein
MRKLATALSVTVIATIAGIFCAPAAAPIMGGRWLITVCEDLTRQTCSTVCYAFTKVPGEVASNPQSGTWSSSDADAFSGKWHQRGEDVTFWGTSTANSVKTSAYFKGAFSSRTQLNGSRFIRFVVPNTNVHIGNWHAQKIRNCPGS